MCIYLYIYIYLSIYVVKGKSLLDIYKESGRAS